MGLGQDSTSITNMPQDSSDRYEPLKFPKIHTDLLINPSLQLGNQSLNFGLTYLKAKFYRHAFTAKAITADFGFLTETNTYTTSLGWSAVSYVLILGAKIGARGVYYWRPKRGSVFALRPEFGLIIANVSISYGYDIFLSKNELSLKNNNFIFTFYIPVFQ